MWFQNAMPWVVPSEYDFATVDFTPNYLCTAKALKNIHSSARDPKELRFIVMMRDPIMCASSDARARARARARALNPIRRAFPEWCIFSPEPTP